MPPLGRAMPCFAGCENATNAIFRANKPTQTMPYTQNQMRCLSGMGLVPWIERAKVLPVTQPLPAAEPLLAGEALAAAEPLSVSAELCIHH